MPLAKHSPTSRPRCCTSATTIPAVCTCSVPWVKTCRRSLVTTAAISKFSRLAVIPAQITRYNLPTVPAKITDRRAFTGLTTQAEALDPRTLAVLVREAITSRMDMDIYSGVLQREEAIREELAEGLR